MRTLKSILLAGAMLLATPAFFSSCQEDAPQIDYTMSVTVVNDFSKVVDAINNGTLKNEQAIAQLTAAIDKMNADQQTKLQAIKDVLNSLNATVDTKLAAIEAAMKAQTITLEGKLALIEDAMKAQTLALEKKCDALVAAIKALPDYTEKLQAIEKAISALPDYTSKLEAIEKALASQTMELSDRLAYIETAMKDQTLKLADKLDALDEAIKALPDYTEQLQAIKTAIDGLPDYNDKLAAIETAMKDQTKKLSEKLAFIEAAMKTQTLTLSAKINTLNTILALHSIDMSLKLNAIKKAIENMPDYTAAFNNIKNEIAKLVKAVEDGNKSQKEALDYIAVLLKELKENSGGDDTSVKSSIVFNVREILCLDPYCGIKYWVDSEPKIKFIVDRNAAHSKTNPLKVYKNDKQVKLDLVKENSTLAYYMFEGKIDDLIKIEGEIKFFFTHYGTKYDLSDAKGVEHLVLQYDTRDEKYDFSKMDNLKTLELISGAKGAGIAWQTIANTIQKKVDGTAKVYSYVDDTRSKKRYIPATRECVTIPLPLQGVNDFKVCLNSDNDAKLAAGKFTSKKWEVNLQKTQFIQQRNELGYTF
ncbi:hypothetical protein I6E38_04960 [Prevotella stercorea]|uniref:hypothetical protein n=1 Tax=Leyella stercorea TaxID=363265 RepID=UPI001F2A62C4|nr:hypothetical protein [Leyella stercorea]MCF2578463.1 hypothetical protein [Leyella stercorea]